MKITHTYLGHKLEDYFNQYETDGTPSFDYFKCKCCNLILLKDGERWKLSNFNLSHGNNGSIIKVNLARLENRSIVPSCDELKMDVALG